MIPQKIELCEFMTASVITIIKQAHAGRHWKDVQILVPCWKTLERKPILLQQTSKSLTLTFSTSWPVLFYFSSFIESVDPRRSFFRFSPSKPLLCVGFPTCQRTSRMAARSTSGSGAALLRLRNVGNSFKLLKWILGWGDGQKPEV